MISDTLLFGLRQYRIEPKLRSLRLKKKLGLVELGRHTGLSAAMLSKIERGLLFPEGAWNAWVQNLKGSPSAHRRAKTRWCLEFRRLRPIERYAHRLISLFFAYH